MNNPRHKPHEGSFQPFFMMNCGSPEQACKEHLEDDPLIRAPIIAQANQDFCCLLPPYSSAESFSFIAPGFGRFRYSEADNCFYIRLAAENESTIEIEVDAELGIINSIVRREG